MNHQDEELADIVVVLVDEPGTEFEESVKQLQGQGMSISDTDNENGVIEGTINAGKVPGLKKLPFVKYVRTVFTYVADFPPGDPRNQDPDDDDEPAEVDDAGA